MARSMASRGASGNNAGMHEQDSFAARGGWWVAAQLPLLLIAVVVSPGYARASGFEHPAQYIGALLLSIGVGVIAAGLWALGTSITPFPRPRENAVLVTRGIYAYVRHPIYAGLIVLALGWALLWLSALGELYAAGLAIFFDRKAAREEVWLRERYPGYAAYAQRVRRFIPGVY